MTHDERPEPEVTVVSAAGHALVKTWLLRKSGGEVKGLECREYRLGFRPELPGEYRLTMALNRR